MAEQKGHEHCFVEFRVQESRRRMEISGTMNTSPTHALKDKKVGAGGGCRGPGH